MTAPLFVTRDDDLLDELLRLAAAAGVTPRWPTTARPPCAAGGRARWSCSAPTWPTRWPALAPPAATGCRGRLGRRARRPVPDRPGRRRGERGGAPAVGAWVAETLTDVGDERPAGGWSSASWAGPGGGCDDVRVRARRRWPRGPDRPSSSTPTRSGPGVDRMLGLEERRHPLGRAVPDHRAGSARALAARGAATRDGLGVLTWYAGRDAAGSGVRRPRGALGRPAWPRHRRGRPAAHRRPGGRGGGGPVRPGAGGDRADRAGRGLGRPGARPVADLRRPVGWSARRPGRRRRRRPG